VIQRTEGRREGERGDGDRMKEGGKRREEEERRKKRKKEGRGGREEGLREGGRLSRLFQILHPSLFQAKYSFS
jgi:hypothetical protein